MSYCVVFLCNKNYFDKFLYTCNGLITKGNYKGEICLVIGDDLKNSEYLEHSLIRINNVIIQHFPDIKFSDQFLEYSKNISRPPHWFQKLFQYHKFHLFNSFFKRWNYIFYIDCGITIHKEISPMLNLGQKNSLLAHSDAYPTYEWKLHNQFSKDKYFEKLSNSYNLNIDYPQTTILIYDTDIINDNTFNEIYNLFLEYPNSITNDQGILALYFTNIRPLFHQIKIEDESGCFYDYMRRNNKEYIMTKM